MKTYKKNTKGKIFYIENQDPKLFLTFQLNPTEISESRGVVWSMSQAQSQILPHAQYGRAEETEISFTLKFFSHKGLAEPLKKLRQLTLPRELGILPYYDQASPYFYFLDLAEYGKFVGVFKSVNLQVNSYHRETMLPVDLDAEVSFVPVSYNAATDLSLLEFIARLDDYGFSSED